MSWKKLLEQGRAERHTTSAEELAALQAVVKRNLADATVEAISPDTRFGCAYDAALILATAAIACAGYRVKGPGHHWTTFEALPLALPEKESIADAQYFDRCRRLRNELSYEAAGVVDVREVDELLARVGRFQDRVQPAIEQALRRGRDRE
jgi:hypothetical protein